MQTHILRFSARSRAAVSEEVGVIRRTMRPWGIRVTHLAMELGVSRQYVWQVMHSRTFVSEEKLRSIESAMWRLIEQKKRGISVGERLRSARIGAGYTLKEAASLIGYTWVAVERWEKNICSPKPGVLWHLRAVYGVDEEWLPIAAGDALERGGYAQVRHRSDLGVI